MKYAYILTLLPLARLAARCVAASVPLIDVTDLYHPYQHAGDNFDILAAYALPEVDPLAIVCLLRTSLPITLYPCAAKAAPDHASGGLAPAFGYDEHNAYWKLPDLRFIPRMDPPLRRYLEYAFSRSSRADFLRATEVDGQPLDAPILAKEHHVWETAVWICVSGRKLVKRADGTYRILPANQVLATDQVLPNEARPCTVSVLNDGIYEFRETTKLSNFSVYYRGDPRENEAALCDALPALYLSFRSTTSQ